MSNQQQDKILTTREKQKGTEKPGSIADGGDAREGAVKEDSEQGEATHEDGQDPDEPIVVGDPLAHQIPLGFRASISPLRTKETKL